MSDSPSMDRLAELQQLIADFSKIQRIPPMGNSGRPENDVEHSFGLALTCWYLQPKVAPDLDLLKILQYALSHDIVELHAGDTFVFDVVRADFWKKLKIDLEMERDNKVSILISEDVSPYYEMLITWLDDRNNIPKS
jgi:5'-deoxynucleotidase YfbR-like HD superfamily hydrolase